MLDILSMNANAPAVAGAKFFGRAARGTAGGIRSEEFGDLYGV